MTFQEFGLSEAVVRGVEAKGYKNATPIQEQAMPLVLAGKDVMGSAQTGTGKTAAFALPILTMLGGSTAHSAPSSSSRPANSPSRSSRSLHRLRQATPACAP